MPGRSPKHTRPPRWVAAGMLGAALAATLACGASPDPPDVLLISIDTLRSDRMSAYGYARETTPNIDRFFAAGSVFEAAVASAPCTVPSIRQYLTGRLLRKPEAETLAEIFRDAGYRTAAIVSQHQFTQPGAWSYARGFDEFDVQGPGEIDHHGMTTRDASEVTDRALAWLAKPGDGRPFFLWLHYFDPHDPYEPPDAYRGFDAGNPSSRSGDRRRYLQAERRSPREPWQRAGYVFSEADVARMRNLYDGEIRFTDAQIGRVLEAMTARGVERSVVALLADHGERLGEDDRWDHCATLSEAELRVPLMFRLRGGPIAGRHRWSAPASTLDLVPTLLAASGIDSGVAAPEGNDWLGGGSAPAVVSQWGPLRAIYRDRWKLVTNGRVHRLFDLAADPRAGRDVARLHPDVVSELSSLAGSREDARRLAAETAAELQRLRSLGYVD